MNWTLTVVNEGLDWYRVKGDDIDYLESEKRRAIEQGFSYYTEIDEDEVS